MLPKTVEELAQAIAELCVDNPLAAKNANLFINIADELEKRGFNLEAHQRGISGTHICITEIANA